MLWKVLESDRASGADPSQIRFWGRSVPDSGPETPQKPMWDGSAPETRSGDEEDAAEGAAALDVAVRVGGFGEREGAVDDDLQLA